MSKIKNIFNVIYSSNIIKPTMTNRFIFIGVGILAGLFVSLITNNPGLNFAIVFVVDFIAFFIRANIKNIRFNYCYFTMVFAGCGIYLMIF